MKQLMILCTTILLFLFACDQQKQQNNTSEPYLGEDSKFGGKPGFRRRFYANELCKKECEKLDSKCWDKIHKRVDEMTDEQILNEWHKIFNPHLAK